MCLFSERCHLPRPLSFSSIGGKGRRKKKFKENLYSVAWEAEVISIIRSVEACRGMCRRWFCTGEAWHWLWVGEIKEGVCFAVFRYTLLFPSLLDRKRKKILAVCFCDENIFEKYLRNSPDESREFIVRTGSLTMRVNGTLPGIYQRIFSYCGENRGAT